jgi:hypothetical protein
MSMQGGISNGEIIYFKVAFKPTATIGVRYSGSSNSFFHQYIKKKSILRNSAMSCFLNGKHYGVVVLWMQLKPVFSHSTFCVFYGVSYVTFEDFYFLKGYIATCLRYWISLFQKKQHTVSREHEDVELLARGRHDPCVVPRAVPMVESMAALVLMDQLMAHIAQCEMFPLNLALQEPVGSASSVPAFAPDLS